jgi:hypothetical protein
MKNNKLRNAMKRFRQGRITLEKLNLIKLACTLEDAKREVEVAPEVTEVQPEIQE